MAVKNARVLRFFALLVVTALVALITACGEDCDEIQRECDTYANDVRRAAAQRGVTSQGICNPENTANPEARKDLEPLCARFSECNNRLKECKN